MIKELEINIPEVKEVIVVFDGTDNTPDVARSSGSKVKVLQFNERLGKGGAVLEGFKVAQGDVLCYTDADGSAPWYEIERLCSLVSDERKAVIGSRWMKSSKVRLREPFFNIVASRLFHYLVFAILGLRVKDTQCGLKAFHKDIAKELAHKVGISDRTFDVAILYHLKEMRIKPIETGIEWSHNAHTNMPILRAIPLMLLTLFALRVRHEFKIGESLKEKMEEFYDSIDFF